MPIPLVFLLFFLSGATGLVYELVWVRELIFVFGGTTYAITTVLVAFMAGLGLGSYAVGRLAHRLERPGRVYGCLEIVIGLYALLVPVLLRLAEPAYRSLYPHVAELPWLLTAIRFCICVPIVLIPTTCMGATLPVLVRYVTMNAGALGRSVGRLYGINTLGAVLGTILAGFWLIPALGLMRTTWLAAGINVLIGTIAILLLRPTGVRAPAPKGRVRTRKAAEAAPERMAVSAAARAAVLAGFAISGFAAMVYQITWTRALVLSLGSSTYSFTCILAAFILGLGTGSLAVARWVDRWRNPVLIFGVLELLLGLVAVLIIPIHGRVPLMAQAIFDTYAGDYGALLRLEFLLVIAITFVPTLLLGAIFPLVTRVLAGEGDDAAAATGRAYAVNTIGTITGSFLAGFVLIRSDTLGVQNSIILASVLNGLVGAALVLLSPRPRQAQIGRRAAWAAGALVLIPLVALFAGRWDPLLFNAGPFLRRERVEDFRNTQKIRYYGEGADLTVAVLEHRSGTLSLTVNGKPDASTGADMATQLLLGHVPALLGPAGGNACIIGLGSGITLAAVARYPTFERLDCVEISDEVIHAAAYFSPYTYHVLTQDPRVHLIRGDGRNHLLLTDRRYDVIVSEPSNPWLSGVSNLFTREFFELCRDRLAPDGVLGIWLQSYTMSVRDFQMVIRTLFDVFDHVSLWQLYESDCMLLASRTPPQVSLAQLQARFETPAVWADLYRVGLYRPAHILGRYITSDDPLRAWVAPAPVHTDDNALLEFSAPQHLYADEGPEISKALASLQRPALPDLLSPADRPAPPALEKEVAAVTTGRWAAARVRATLRQANVGVVLRTLLDAYRGDMSNVGLHSFMETVINTAPPGAGDLAALKAEFTQMRAPLSAPLEGVTLPEIAAMRRKVADEALRRGDAALAIDDLQEAVRLEPDHRGTRLALASILAQNGREAEAEALLDPLAREFPDDGRVSYVRAILAVRANNFDIALTLLGSALRAGAVTPQRLAADEALRPLRGEPRFEALLAPASTSAPAAGNP